MSEIFEKELPDRMVKWLINAVDPRATVESIHRLHGGTSSIVHRVSLRVNHTVEDVVLRQFDNREWLQEEPDLALHEAESLRMASQVDSSTPEIIAFDDTGSECGVPAVLMSKLAGTVVLQPENMDEWLRGLAESLAQIHKVEAADFLWTYFTYNDITALEIPSWSSVPGLWEKGISIVKRQPPRVKECFIHRDYHPTNVLWDQNKVSGIVDWVNACRGPAGIDVGHCRLNLAMLCGVSTADSFLTAYQSYAGEAFQYDPYWDLLSLMDILFGPPEVYPGWAAFGVTGLTDKLMEERLDKYMTSLIDRIAEKGE